MFVPLALYPALGALYTGLGAIFLALGALGRCGSDYIFRVQIILLKKSLFYVPLHPQSTKGTE